MTHTTGPGDRPPDWWATLAQHLAPQMVPHGASLETRVALAEQRISHVETYSRDRINAHSERLIAGDERMRKLGSRIGQTSDQVAAHAREIARIDPLVARVAAIETAAEAEKARENEREKHDRERSAKRRAIASVAAAVWVPVLSLLLIAAGATGRVSMQTVETALPHLQKLAPGK